MFRCYDDDVDDVGVFSDQRIEELRYDNVSGSKRGVWMESESDDGIERV